MELVIGIAVGLAAWLVAGVIAALVFFRPIARRNAEYDRQLHEWMEQQK
jgi:hypothetical protein